MKVKLTKTIDRPGLGKEIRKRREAIKGDLTQLAAKANISVVHWGRIEKEQVKTLPITTLRRIEEALNTNFGVGDR